MQDIEDPLKKRVREYLRYSSIDGDHRRKQLREEIAQMVAEPSADQYEAQEPPSLADGKWHEFSELFREVCHSWGYHAPNLALHRKEMTPVNEEVKLTLVRKALQRRQDRQVPAGSSELRDIIGSYFPVDNLPTQCPFCDDKTKTFLLTGDRWHCGSCQSEGDVADFVALYEHTSREDAIRRLLLRHKNSGN